MKVLQINSSVNTGSTGRIAEEIGQTLLRAGHESWIAFGRPVRESQSSTIRIGGAKGQFLHGLQTRIFDTHGFGSKADTARFVQQAAALQPDIVHLHNLHGYYLHAGVLFNWLRAAKVPVVWTLHDCWPFTGHCTFFDSVQCEKWKTACHHCPKTKAYPSSYVFDASAANYARKKKLFGGAERLHLVTPSEWLAAQVRQSYLKAHPLNVIYNGVDPEIFHPEAPSDFRERYQCRDQKIILGVASIWDKRKGLEDFKQLSRMLPPDHRIVLVGLDEKQQEGLSANITGISRTDNLAQLAGLYATADVFVNPTWQDNFPTTNIEALAAGTPVVTYNTGGSPEAVNEATGLVLPKGEVAGLLSAITAITSAGKQSWTTACRQRALQCFNRSDRYTDYLRLYSALLEPGTYSSVK
jgi:glycosyltransferase involved in cell wall biosynthesis